MSLFRAGIPVESRQLTGAAGLLGPAPDIGPWDLGIAALFAGRQFCSVRPVRLRGVRVALGTGDDGRIPYASDLGESFDGEILMYPAAGQEEPMIGTFREWPAACAVEHTRGSAPSEDPTTPSKRGRRVVAVSLPRPLRDHDEDLVLLTRVSRLVSELAFEFVDGGGATTHIDAGPLDNLFDGGLGADGPPEPILFGPKLPGFLTDGLAGA